MVSFNIRIRFLSSLFRVHDLICTMQLICIVYNELEIQIYVLLIRIWQIIMYFSNTVWITLGNKEHNGVNVFTAFDIGAIVVWTLAAWMGRCSGAELCGDLSCLHIKDHALIWLFNIIWCLFYSLISVCITHGEWIDRFVFVFRL